MLDAFSPRVVGQGDGKSLEDRAAARRVGNGSRTAKSGRSNSRSDHGCQYTSVAFGKRCGEIGVRPSMASVGDAYDNAMAESFFATLECELLNRRRFRLTSRHATRYSALSMAGTTPTGGTRRSVTFRRSATKSWPQPRLDSQPKSVHRNGATPDRADKTHWPWLKCSEFFRDPR